MWPAETEVMVWQQVKSSDVSLGTHLRYTQVADKDIKKPTKQTKVTMQVFCSEPNDWLILLI